MHTHTHTHTHTCTHTQAKSRSKSHVTLEQFEEKEKRVQHLEEVNISLKQTNDDLNEELAELRKQLGELRQKVCVDGGGGEVFYLTLEWRCGELEWEGVEGKYGRDKAE